MTAQQVIILLLVGIPVCGMVVLIIMRFVIGDTDHSDEETDEMLHNQYPKSHD